MTATTIENALVAWVCGVCAFVYWPWDWRGRRRAVTLKTRDRKWWD